MPDNEKRPGTNRPHPETFSQLLATDSTATQAPAFVLRAWQRWNLAIDEAAAVELKPWPLAESAAAGIWAEWHV